MQLHLLRCISHLSAAILHDRFQEVNCPFQEDAVVLLLLVRLPCNCQLHFLIECYSCSSTNHSSVPCRCTKEKKEMQVRYPLTLPLQRGPVLQPHDSIIFSHVIAGVTRRLRGVSGWHAGPQSCHHAAGKACMTRMHLLALSRVNSNCKWCWQGHGCRARLQKSSWLVQR